ncbi:MAG: response regulator transcription factor [Proteobacteria bacterium]|nr:response regulator transcription factor [Pseudomonadota bacterium]
MKILLVDDSRFVRFSVIKFLKASAVDEHVFLEAASGNEAIVLYEQENPDIVFLDLLLPDISGEDVLSEIRKKGASSFVVVLTSNFQKPVKERLLDGGADLFVEKTITQEKISDIMAFYASAKGSPGSSQDSP